jgi:hypothetical protein
MAVVPAADIVAAFQAALTIPVLSHSTATPEYDLFEVYLFGLAIEAARSIGMTVDFVNAAGTPTTSLTLRTSPSAISSTAQPFSHATLSLNGTVRLEVHLGIYIRAGSGVSHEGDVAVLDAGEAARARALLTDPRVPKTAIVIEAKFYSSNVRLRTGREFLGLGVDFGADATVFVSSAPSNSVHRLLSYRKRPSHFELVPGAAQETELRARIATQLRDYIARNP